MSGDAKRVASGHICDVLMPGESIGITVQQDGTIRGRPPEEEQTPFIRVYDPKLGMTHAGEYCWRRVNIGSDEWKRLCAKETTCEHPTK